MKSFIDIGNEILTLPKHPMSREQSQCFVMCSMSETQKIDLPPEIEQSFPYQVIDKRLAYWGVEVTPWVKVFVAMIIDSPGLAVLYCAALGALWAKKGQVTMNVFAGLDGDPQTFGMGLPSEEDLHVVWENQKIHDGRGSDNMLDRPQPTRSNTHAEENQD